MFTAKLWDSENGTFRVGKGDTAESARADLMRQVEDALYIEKVPAGENLDTATLWALHEAWVVNREM